jgi:hypothetical protein
LLETCCESGKTDIAKAIGKKIKLIKKRL